MNKDAILATATVQCACGGAIRFTPDRGVHCDSPNHPRGASVTQQLIDAVEGEHSQQRRDLQALRAQLRALITDWREKAHTRLAPGHAEAIQVCADQLAALLGED